MSAKKSTVSKTGVSVSYYWGDFVDIAARLDSTINFTLIRFLFRTLQMVLGNHEIILINASLLLFINTTFASNLLLNIEVIFNNRLLAKVVFINNSRLALIKMIS